MKTKLDLLSSLIFSLGVSLILSSCTKATTPLFNMMPSGSSSGVAPANFTIASVVPSSGKAVLTWSSAANATSYRVRYGLSSGSYPTTVSTSATSPYTVNNLTNGVKYYFMVTAVNSAGASDATSELSVTPSKVWESEAYLKGSTSVVSGGFGQYIASSNDAVAVVGASKIYVFRKTGELWAQEAILAPPVTTNPVSLAFSGDTIVAGWDRGTNAAAGAAYVYRKTGGSWALERTLTAVNGESGDAFGYSVAIDGDTIVVGALDEASGQMSITNGSTASADNSIGRSGAAYVYRRSGTTWSQEAYLKPSNTMGTMQFGCSVGISGDTIAVGAWYESSNQKTITNGPTASTDTSQFGTGAVYVFKRAGNNWSQQAYLKASNSGRNNTFGSKVAISADTIAVAASRERSNQRFVTNGAAASSDTSFGDSTGAAYIFKRTADTWVQEAYLKPSNLDPSDYFGWSIAILGDTVAVGSIYEDGFFAKTMTNMFPMQDDNASANSGAVYVFQRTGATWAQQAYLKAPNFGGEDWMGFSVAVGTDSIFSGASREDGGVFSIINGPTGSDDNSVSDAGAAYVFRRK